MDVNTVLDHASETSNAASEAAREEYAKILNDKDHPMHAGLLRGDKAVNDHLDGFYKKVGTGTMRIGLESLSSHPVNLSETPTHSSAVEVVVGDGRSVSVNTADVEHAQIEALTPTEVALRQVMAESGDDYLAEKRTAGVAYQHLFGSDEGMAAYARLYETVQRLPPEQRIKAEVATHFYMTEMGQLFSEGRA